MHLLTPYSQTSKPIRIFSYGGGVQSNSVLVLQATGKLPQDYDVFVFANVGAKSEASETLHYVENYAKPFADQHGIKFVEVSNKVDLYDYAMNSTRDFPLPLRMSHNSAPGNRSCTTRWKINKIDAWWKVEGYTHAIMGLGISMDEAARRMRDQNWHKLKGVSPLRWWRKREYPLVQLRIFRQDCRGIITDAGLPEPPKSSCWYCPLRHPNYWIRLRNDDPITFWKTVYLEQYTNAKRAILKRDPIYFHPACLPLDQATAKMELLPGLEVDEMEACTDAVCDV